MSIIVEGRLLENRFTTAQWAASTVVLKDRVWGHEVDVSGNPIGSKMGNGVDLWAALPYWYGGTSVIPDVHDIEAGVTEMPLILPFESTTYPAWNAVKAIGEYYDQTYPVQYIMADQWFIINAMDDGSGKALESYTVTINP